jgi:uncharacterized protein
MDLNKNVSKLSALLFTSLFLLVAGRAEAGNVVVPGASLGNLNVKVSSMRELRFKSTIAQRYDFSCGSAALATLLTYHYEDPVDEARIFTAMYDKGDKEKIHKEGFSLLDMKNYLESNGYKADGFRISLDKLIEVGVPAIVLIHTRGFKHFVVIKGATQKDVLLGDPALGNKVVTRAEFENMWNGLVFMVRNKKNIAAQYFNRKEDWQANLKSSVAATANINTLMSLTLFLPLSAGQ